MTERRPTVREPADRRAASRLFALGFLGLFLELAPIHFLSGNI